MASVVKTVRWSIRHAGMEFDVDDKTLNKAIKTMGIEAGKDGKYSTMDICKAVFGDLEGDRVRAQTKQAEEAAKHTAVKTANLLKQNIPADLVVRVWSATLTDLRQKISYSNLDDKSKSEILKDLQNVPVEDYFKDAKGEEETDEKE